MQCTDGVHVPPIDLSFAMLQALAKSANAHCKAYSNRIAGHWRASLSEVHASAGHARSSCIHMIVIRM